MTVINLSTAFTGADLLTACSSLGVRRPLGLAESMAVHPSNLRPSSSRPFPVALTEDTAIALTTLAAPEAIAVAERTTLGRKRIVYVARRGPAGAVHRIHGDRHYVEAISAEDAGDALLGAIGLDSPAADAVRADTTIDTTSAAYDRMTELIGLDDLPRAAAALEADGASRVAARSIVHAAAEQAVHVLGLRCIGLRYEGCELSWIGRSTRWLVPLVMRDAGTGIAREPARPRHLRVTIDPVEPSWLRAELSRLFD